MTGNYMRANKIERMPILAAMPGPWGVAIARLRAARGWNQQKAAKRAKITPTTYGRIEKGGHTQTSKLQKIADAFSVGIEAVLVPDSPNASSMSLRDVVAQLVREEKTEGAIAADKEEMERDAAVTKKPKRASGRKK